MITFKEAIAFYKQKLPLPTETWDQIIRESQDWAFTLAGVEKASVLQSVFDLILNVLENKVETVTTYEDFAKNFNDIMVNSGYGEQKPWRTRMVFKQNIKTAYNAGRYRTQADPENIKRRPYLQYIHDHPIVPRPHHKALHNKIWRADDPIWQSIYPSNGFGCNCQCQSLSERDMKREGLKVSDSISDRITLRDKLTGLTRQVPAIRIQKSEFRVQNYPPQSIIEDDTVLCAIAELGFNYAPGASTQERRREILNNAIARLSPRLQRMVRDANPRI